MKGLFRIFQKKPKQIKDMSVTEVTEYVDNLCRQVKTLCNPPVSMETLNKNSSL